MGQESGTWLTILEESHKGIENKVLPTPREKNLRLRGSLTLPLGRKRHE